MKLKPKKEIKGQKGFMTIIVLFVLLNVILKISYDMTVYDLFGFTSSGIINLLVLVFALLVIMVANKLITYMGLLKFGQIKSTDIVMKVDEALNIMLLFKSPMTVSSYRYALMMPLLVLGVLPIVFNFVFINPYFVFVGIITLIINTNMLEVIKTLGGEKQDKRIIVPVHQSKYEIKK